jgi:hypothetical protein
MPVTVRLGPLAPCRARGREVGCAQNTFLELERSATAGATRVWPYIVALHARWARVEPRAKCWRQHCRSDGARRGDDSVPRVFPCCRFTRRTPANAPHTRLDTPALTRCICHRALVTQVSAPKAALRAKSSLARGARRSLKVAAADKWAALDPKYDQSDDQQVRAASRSRRGHQTVIVRRVQLIHAPRPTRLCCAQDIQRAKGMTDSLFQGFVGQGTQVRVRPESTRPTLLLGGLWRQPKPRRVLPCRAPRLPRALLRRVPLCV